MEVYKRNSGKPFICVLTVYYCESYKRGGMGGGNEIMNLATQSVMTGILNMLKFVGSCLASEND